MISEIPNRCIFNKGDLINGQFTVLKVLGEGTFGSVYKVVDNKDNVFALKILKLWEVHPTDREVLIKRFDMEFATGQIQSDYLVHSYSYGKVEGNPFIIMEYCPNGDMRNVGRNESERIYKAGRDILFGLKDLHASGKIHRDLKPDNVLFRANGVAVLTDFGIAGDQNKRMTERGWLGKPQQIFGTYGYMPPEQVRPPRGGKATVLPTTDIFSFGVMMYEMVTGKLPFGPLNDESDLMPYLNNARDGIWDREPLKRIANAKIYESVVEGCLVPDFHKRLQQIDNVLELYTGHSSQPVIHTIYDNYYLTVMQGEEYGRKYDLNSFLLPNRNLLRIGREDYEVDNDILIKEENSCYISRQHCTIEKDPVSHVWYLRDGQWDKWSTRGWKYSMNGTFINSTEVPESGCPIHDGDIISIGDVKLKVGGY